VLGAFCPFTTGLIGCSCLWIFIRPLREGTEGFILMYFHLLSLGIMVGLRFTVFLTWDWFVFVGYVGAMWKLLSLRKSVILLSYCGVGRMHIEFPFSTQVSVASCSLSLVWMDLIILVSGRVLWVVCCSSLSMRSATVFL
jgi:hypothetical protein